MTTSITIKSMIAHLLYRAGGISWRLRHFSQNSIVILMYHRVIPKSLVTKKFHPGIYVETETFEQHLVFLNKYFSIKPIYELSSKVPGNFFSSKSKPICVLTFDDGWCDFYTSVFPILKSHQVPATVFLPTDFIGTEKWFWTDRLALLFKQRGNTKNPSVLGQLAENALADKLQTLKGSYEFSLETAIELLKSHPNEVIKKTITDLSSFWGVTVNPSGRAFLSWEEAREIAKSGLITFGSHTESHRILTFLKESEIQDELRKSKERLLAEEVVDSAFIPFSYPNGNYNDRIARMVKEAGYSLAVSTKKGWNNNGSDLFALNRINIHQDMTATEALFASRIVGIL